MIVLLLVLILICLFPAGRAAIGLAFVAGLLWLLY